MCWRRNKRSEKCKQNAAFCQKYSNPTVKSANKIIRIISAHFNERLLHALWWLGELKACSSKWADRSTVCNYVKRAYSCSQLVILDFFLRTVGFNKKIQREIRRSRARGEFPKIKSFNVENRHTHTHTPTLSHTHTMKSSLFWVGKYYSLTGVRFGEGCCGVLLCLIQLIS